MQYRMYRDEKLSVVGFGGILVMNESASEADRLVGMAIDRGINYFDVAPSYGNAQEMLGPALAPYRKKVFLACKSNVRDTAGVEREFNQSLEQLKTDYLDLYQIHAIQTEEEVDKVIAPGGVLDFISRLKEAGLVRNIGFSAHNEGAALRLLRHFHFDSVLFPINRYIWHNGGVGPDLVAAASEDNVIILALKALAHRRRHDGEVKTRSKAWYKPVDSAAEAERGLRFTLSRPVTAAVSPGHEELFTWMCDAADRFKPLSAEEEEEIRRSVRDEPEDDVLFSKRVAAI